MLLLSVLNLIIYYTLTYILGGWCLLMQLIKGRKPFTDTGIHVGKVAIVTGGSLGIGFQVAKGLVARSIHVFIGGKCRKAGKDAITSIREDFPNAKVDFIHLDLGSLKSVDDFAKDFLSRDLQLNILINNAGIMFPRYELTEDGFESQFQVNYLGHFYLTSHLQNKLAQSGASNSWARVVNVSSYMHIIGSPNLENLENRAEERYDYSSHKAYSDSKLLILASMYALNRKLRDSDSRVSVCALHPGVVRTDLWKHLAPIHKYPLELVGKWLYLTPEQGADTTLYAALSTEVEGVSGAYYDNSQPFRSAKLTYDEDFQDSVWAKTSTLIEKATRIDTEKHSD